MSNKHDTIHHLALNVADIEEAIRWYTTSFNCQLLYQDAREAILQFENIRLALVLPSLQQPHLAFVRDDASTLGELREQTGGLQATFLADSSGNIVEVIEKSSTKEEVFPEPF